MQFFSRPLILAQKENPHRAPQTASQDHPLADSLDQVIEGMRAGPWGEEILESAAGYGVEISQDDENGIDVDPAARILFVPGHCLSEKAIARSVYFTHEFQINAIRGLRQIDQVERTVLPRYLGPDQAILFARMCAADQMAVTLAVLYDLRSDHPGLWRHMLGSPWGDMAACFAQARGRTKEALNAAFLLWYADGERVSATDRQTLAALDCELQNSKTPGLYRARLTDQVIRNVCTLGAFGAYLGSEALLAIQAPPFETTADAINKRHLEHILRDQNVVTVNNISFRDASLARAIFPDA